MSRARGAASDAFVFDPEAVLRQASRGSAGDNLLEAAKAQAQAVVQAAKAESAAVTLEARSKGLEDGRAAAAAEWKQAIEDMLAEKQRFSDDLESSMLQIETQLVDLAVEIASKIVRSEIERGSEVVMRAVQAALTQIRDRSNLTIHVNASDLEMVRAGRDQISAWVDGLTDLEIVEDRRVEKGGVVIDSGDGTLDARPSSQLSEIRRKLQDSSEEK